MITTAEGSTFTVSAEFTDDDDNLLYPVAGYPKVVLLDEEGDVLYSTVGLPDPQTPGLWSADITVPKLSLTAKTEMKVRWRFRAQTGEKLSEKERVIITPTVERRDSDIVIMHDDTFFTFVLPMAIDVTQGHTGSIKIYNNNDTLVPEMLFSDPQVKLTPGVDRTQVRVNLPASGVVLAKLESYMCRIRVTLGDPATTDYITVSHNLWVLTPSILKAMSFIEAFLNKARVENVIPQLEWTPGDLLNYLERGLNMFNRLVHITAFTGTNMQGMLFDAWMVCSCYWAISAQLLAEGALSFDFSGQGVSLNVDRTPQLDAALGRIEQDMDNRIVPFKKEIVKQGVIGGDGSNGGGPMRNPQAFGVLSLTNAPTTRINGLGLGSYGRVFRRF